MSDSTKTADAFRADLVSRFNVTGSRLVLVDRLLDLYRRKHVLEGERDRPLYAICPKAAECWADGRACLPVRRDRSGIAVPWIGDRYERTGICVVAINLDDWGGLDAHWYFCRGYGEDLAAGRRGKRGLPFAHGVACYVSAVEAAREGHPPASAAVPPPKCVADGWEGCAFLEAVKCSPDRPSAEPLDPMWANCPSTLLLDELAILTPSVVLLLGRSKLRDPIRGLLLARADLEYGESPGNLERDHFAIAGRRIELLTLNHPSFPSWIRSYGQLVDSLLRDPP